MAPREWERLDETDAVTFVIELGGETAGCIQYSEEPDPDYFSAAVDIFVSAAVHGRGVGGDAMRTLIAWLFDARGHHRLTVDPAAANARAIHVYGKLGFRPVGVLREYERVERRRVARRAAHGAAGRGLRARGVGAVSAGPCQPTTGLRRRFGGTAPGTASSATREEPGRLPLLVVHGGPGIPHDYSRAARRTGARPPGGLLRPARLRPLGSSARPVAVVGGALRGRAARVARGPRPRPLPPARPVLGWPAGAGARPAAARGHREPHAGRSAGEHGRVDRRGRAPARGAAASDVARPLAPSRGRRHHRRPRVPGGR